MVEHRLFPRDPLTDTGLAPSNVQAASPQVATKFAPQPPGLGLARNVNPATQPGTVRGDAEIPLPARAAPRQATRPNRLPGDPGFQFRDNPLAAIGLIMQGFAAGARGRPNPALAALNARAQSRRNEQTFKLQQLKVGAKFIKDALDRADRLPPQDREKFITSALAKTERILPGVTEEALDGLFDPQVRTVAGVLPYIGDALSGLCFGAKEGFEQCIVNGAKDESLVNRLVKNKDREEVPLLKERLDTLLGLVESDPQGKEAIAAQGDFTLSDIVKLNIFNRSDLDIIERNIDQFPRIIDDRGVAREGLLARAKESRPELLRLQEARAAAPEGSKEREEIDRKIAKSVGTGLAAGDLLDETGALKVNVSNSIRNTVAQLLGGVLDAKTGQFSLLDADKSKEAVKISADAEGLIRSRVEFSVAAAVQRAAQASDFTFPLSSIEQAIAEEAADAILKGAPIEEIFKRIRETLPQPSEAEEPIRGSFDPLRIIDFLKEKIRGGGS